MSSKAITEAWAKSILYSALSTNVVSRNPHRVVSLDNPFVPPYDSWVYDCELVAKPDVLLKRRGKLGLVLIRQNHQKVADWIKEMSEKVINVGSVSGTLQRFLVEPFVPHKQSEEYYVCIYTQRDFNVILFHHEGGVDVGAIDDKAKRFEVPVHMLSRGPDYKSTGCTAEQLLTESQSFRDVSDESRRRVLAEFIADLHRVFDELHFTYIEINPLVVCSSSSSTNSKTDDSESSLRVHLLDAAAKLDQCAEFLFYSNRRWYPDGPLSFEFPSAFGRTKTAEEAYIADLDARTGASMKLSILNPEGRVWTMCAGGGASVIYADTVCDLADRVRLHEGIGLGANDLANYGEYSGAPSEGQTYDYAKTILTLMTRGPVHAEGKVLLIGGGIANFTNVAATFKGIVRALTEFQDDLKRHGVQIFVRRAGPNYQEGLKIMWELGFQTNIPIHVFGPETHMTAIVSMAFGFRDVPTKRSELESHPGSSYAESAGTTGAGFADGDAAGMLRKLSTPTANNFTPDFNILEIDSQLAQNADSDHTESLFTSKTRCVVWGMQLKAIQSMMDFDYTSGREQPSVVAVVYPFGDARKVKVYWGSQEQMVHVYRTISEAVIAHPDARILVNFGSFRVAYDIAREAIGIDRIHTDVTDAKPNQSQFSCVAIIAEGIPENFTRQLIYAAKQRGVLLIGPATVGGIKPGCFKIGNTGGMIDNIVSSRLYRPGSVAYVSRSGGMSNELNNIISLNSDGVEEGVAIGGDRYPGSTFLDHILRFEANPKVYMIVLLGEVGGTDEYAVADAVRNGLVKKPVVAWCIGTCAQALSREGEIQFGHAGACANSQRETAVAKNAAMAEAGIHVPDNFDELDKMIKTVFDDLVKTGRVIPRPTGKPRHVPIDYAWAKELGLIRKPTAFTSTICDDRGAELSFAGVPISQVISENLGIGGVIGLLWFKRRLPEYASKFLELCLVITADHGPAVSGALNTIVTARAGKDLLSSLAAGLLTIGDRFGGALDAAARQFSRAFDSGLTPAQFVSNERQASRLIMGIGHRVKSITNPDMRVRLLDEYIHKHFPATPLVDFALAVEHVTTSKRPNLILNVDGMIGVAMVDLLRHCGQFTREEANEYISIGTLNGLFVLGRSIGFIGHYLDQKQLHQGLYRHPWEDISYMVPSNE